MIAASFLARMINFNGLPVVNQLLQSLYYKEAR
jgi:hypothetical protein